MTLVGNEEIQSFYCHGDLLGSLLNLIAIQTTLHSKRIKASQANKQKKKKKKGEREMSINTTLNDLAAYFVTIVIFQINTKLNLTS